MGANYVRMGDRLERLHVARERHGIRDPARAGHRAHHRRVTLLEVERVEDVGQPTTVQGSAYSITVGDRLSMTKERVYGARRRFSR
jgi:hypothetical protein